MKMWGPLHPRNQSQRGAGLGPHRMGQRVHAPTVLRQQAAGVLHAPVGRCVQGGPAVAIPELGVIASLEEQPGGQRGWGQGLGVKDQGKGCGGSIPDPSHK